MSLWIKICGNTTLADARMSAEAGADALGFVFAASPRRVTPDQVAAITPHLPSTVEKIGVFVDASLAEIAATVEACSLTGVQLHFHTTPDLPAQLRRRFGAALRILRVVRFTPDFAAMPADLDEDSSTDAILVDSRSSVAPGGTGLTFDWLAARKTLFQNEEARKRRIAAGGLTPKNVAEAIAILRPWGVDVASGVESAPGRKDPIKVRAFIAEARRVEHN